jgi:FHA domain-containing protein
MAVVRAHLLSSLVAQRRALVAEFPAKFPHAWLVWEIGVFKPSPRGASTATRGVMRASLSAPAASSGDPLCYELGEQGPFKIGRAADCDVRLNEETVSRDHLWLEPVSGGGWVMRPGSPTSVTYVGGRALPSDGLTLKSRETLELGNVVLTFETAQTLLRRVDFLAGGS